MMRCPDSSTSFERGAGLLLVGVLWGLLSPTARADVFAEAKLSCMKSCSGPCCEERCDYTACAAQVMTTDRSGVEMTDPGAWGAALAVCETQIQRIRQCTARYLEQRRNEERRVTVHADTAPDPRRVDQRYSFTLSVTNPGPGKIEVFSVGAQTRINGIARQGSTSYFKPETHGSSGWRTSVVPPGSTTIIYHGSATAAADGLGRWTTKLTFHTSVGDFDLETSSTVVR